MSISNQKTSLFFRLSISATVFGALFKFVSWPLIILGATGMVVFHAIHFFQKKDRLALDYSRHLLIVSFSCNYVFSIFNLPYGNVLSVITKLALIVFLALYVKKIIFSYVENTQNKALLLSSIGTENMSYLLADLSTVYIVIASLFKIFEWKFGILNGDVLLIIGLFSALVSIVTSSKVFGK